MEKKKNSQNLTKETTLPGEAKTYSSVEEMVADITGDTELVNEVAKRCHDQEIVKMFVAFRTSKELSQQQLADLLGCSQSTISKIENGVDADLKVGEIQAYLRALEKPLLLFFMPNGTAVERVKALTTRIQDEINFLTKLAHKDELIKVGVINHCCETILNQVNYVLGVLKDLPNLSEESSVPQSENSVQVAFDEKESSESCNHPSEDNGNCLTV